MERDGPWQVALPPPAAARREATQSSDSVAERDAGSKTIHGQSHRQVLRADVPEGKPEGGEKSAVIDTRGLQCRNGEDLAGIVQVELPIEKKHEQFSPCNAHQGAIDGQIADLFAG